MIKIISNWSNPGGSTIAFINLCNLFNENGMDCIFFGPHRWHLGQCEALQFSEGELPTDPNDILITHFCFIMGIKPKLHILSCHETNMFPLDTMDTALWDKIHFVSNGQKEWHNIDHPNQIVIPNYIPKIESKCIVNERKYVAGVIGSIDTHKQTHLSIKRALEDQCDEVLIFGAVTDPAYFNEYVLPLLGEKVRYCDFQDNKAEMYSNINCVYHSSKRETYNMVKAECMQLGIEYNGYESAETDGEVWESKKIVEAWKEIMDA